ncbi:MAG TPA: TetR/AcrR family transcriptional regulator [Actinomycetota bacterium]|nr:TetR/AcrR family transcriptional regulator [Actinomycetota bacterium]
MAAGKPAAVPAGAKRRMRGPERRAQLLAVARRVFGRSGFHGVSMDEVAKEAGVTKPILYDHFNSKEELYIALLDADASSLEERVRSALQARTGNRERIERSFQAYFDFVDEHAGGFRLLMQETTGGEEMFRSKVQEVRDQIVSDVGDLIVRESHGKIERRDADTVSLALVGMVETVAQRDPGGNKAERRRSVETLVRLAWRGITNLTI